MWSENVYTDLLSILNEKEKRIWKGKEMPVPYIYSHKMIFVKFLLNKQNNLKNILLSHHVTHYWEHNKKKKKKKT